MKRSVLLIPVILVVMITILACSATPLTTRISRGLAAAQGALPAGTPTTTTAALDQATATAESPSSLPTLAGSIPTATPAAVAPTKAPEKITNASQPEISASSGDVTAYQATLESVYQKVNPSVVSIQVIEPGSAGSANGGAGGGIALGSGFIWDTQGHIVTNNHVVSGASSITVTFSDGTMVDATLVGADPNADLAVIKVDAPANLLVPVQVGDSTQVKVGELVIAIGNPFGLANTMTHGIISALARTLPVGLDNQTQLTQTTPNYNIPDIIQTDAPINPGNSGGVLVDLSGHLLGVTAAIESSSQSNSGIGFVIPAEIVNKVVVPIVQTGKFNHPYLGVTITSVSPEIAQAMNLDKNQKGALIVAVTPGGPASKANLKGGTQQVTIGGGAEAVGGDIITAVGDHQIVSNDDLISYIFIHTNSGDTVTFTILRQGKEMKVQVTIGIFPAQ